MTTAMNVTCPKPQNTLITFFWVKQASNKPLLQFLLSALAFK